MPQPHLRAADADRTAVADLLGEHMAAGRLTVAEYDERLARAYAARTYGELDELTTDLPPLTPARTPPPAPVPAASSGPVGCGHWATGGWGWASWGGSRAAAWASWLSTAVIVVGIWLVSSLGSGEWLYPWPIWVVGPWGLVLLAQTLTEGRGDPGPDRRLPS